MWTVTKKESSIGAVVGAGARSIRRMCFLPLTAQSGLWLSASLQHQNHSTSCRSDKPVQFNSL
jgi:hypothetical protein